MEGSCSGRKCPTAQPNEKKKSIGDSRRPAGQPCQRTPMPCRPATGGRRTEECLQRTPIHRPRSRRHWLPGESSSPPRQGSLSARPSRQSVLGSEGDSLRVPGEGRIELASLLLTNGHGHGSVSAPFPEGFVSDSSTNKLTGPVGMSASASGLSPGGS
jgi:hypothetical protein